MAIVRKKPLPLATPEAFEGVTLMRMRSENIKRVRLVDISLNEPLTLIGGDNSNGKTSFLDSFGICLGGKEAIPADPIHHGKQVGTIRCDFGDGKDVKLSVLCTIKKVGDADWISDVDLEIPGHIAPTAVQTFLGKLTGKFSFDPMEFDGLTPAEQFETMQRFVSDFDFRKHAANYKKIYDARRDVNRDQSREQSAADSVVYAAEPPAERVDEAALAEELRLAGEKNLDIERRRNKRQRAVEAIEVARAVVANTESAIAVAVQSAEAIRDQEIERVRRVCAETIERETVRIRSESQQALASANELQARLDAAAPLSDTVDAAEISARITAARESNRRLDAWESLKRQHAAYQKKADELAKRSADMTAELDAMDAAKDKAIREARMPVEGLGFGDGFVTLASPDGSPVPWEQAGTAERMEASCAIAMALNPKLKVILIRDGSNLGKTLRERIRQRAADKGYRVLMEVVEEGAGTHVVIEDGMVKDRSSEVAA